MVISRLMRAGFRKTFQSFREVFSYLRHRCLKKKITLKYLNLTFPVLVLRKEENDGNLVLNDNYIIGGKNRSRNRKLFYCK